MISYDTKPQVCAAKLKPEAGPAPALPHLVPDNTSVVNHLATSVQDDNQPPSKKMKTESYFDDFFSDIMITKVQPALSPMERAKKELKLHLTLPVITDPNSKFNLLNWW